MTIRDSVTRIGEGAFDSCKIMTLRVSSGRYAEWYTKDKGIAYAIAG